MLRALYTAGTGMMTQMRHIDVTGNNISNANTSGFKKDRSISNSFGDMLINRINDPGQLNNSSVVGPLSLGTYMDETVTSHQQGSLDYTGKSVDFSLQGNGFFVVNTQDGERYTRGGSCFINNDGYLLTDTGHQLMGENGPIQLWTDDFTVDTYGNIFVDNVYTDTLQLVNIQDTNLLQKEGNLLFNNIGDQTNVTQFDGEILQGYLESSNVDITQELIQMMASVRNYDSNQRIIRMLDDTLAKTVNEVGRV